jgi:hypothetical protein
MTMGLAWLLDFLPVARLVGGPVRSLLGVEPLSASELRGLAGLDDAALAHQEATVLRRLQAARSRS